MKIAAGLKAGAKSLLTRERATSLGQAAIDFYVAAFGEKRAQRYLASCARVGYRVPSAVPERRGTTFVRGMVVGGVIGLVLGVGIGHQIRTLGEQVTIGLPAGAGGEATRGDVALPQ